MITGLLLQGLWAQTYAVAAPADAASLLLPADICHAAGADRSTPPDAPVPIGHHPAHCPLCQLAGVALLPPSPYLPPLVERTTRTFAGPVSFAAPVRLFTDYAARGPPAV